MAAWDDYEEGYALGWAGKPLPADAPDPMSRGYRMGVWDKDKRMPFGANCFPPLEDYPLPGGW